jgi:hypothetical protein
LDSSSTFITLFEKMRERERAHVRERERGRERARGREGERDREREIGIYPYLRILMSSSWLLCTALLLVLIMDVFICMTGVDEHICLIMPPLQIC